MNKHTKSNMNKHTKSNTLLLSVRSIRKRKLKFFFLSYAVLGKNLGPNAFWASVLQLIHALSPKNFVSHFLYSQGLISEFHPWQSSIRPLSYVHFSTSLPLFTQYDFLTFIIFLFPKEFLSTFLPNQVLYQIQPQFLFV